MRRNLFSLLPVLAAVTSPALARAESDVDAPRIERLSPALDALVPTGAAIEVIATGFQWTEGPLWIESQQMLLFSDVPANAVYAWREGDGVHEWLKPSGYTSSKPRGGEPGANGLALDAGGRLLLCQHGDRRIARMRAPLAQPTAEYETVAARYERRRFNSPNDLVVDSAGNVWFTDPPYGLEGGPDDPAREMDVFGVYRVGPGGKAERLVEDLTRPNGIGLSPDEKTLYVANSDPEWAIWIAYRIASDGSLSKGRVFFDATADVDEAPGLPDGLEVDRHGNLFAAGPGGVLIFTPAGELLGRIVTGVATANVAFNADESVLYITADDSVMRVRLR
ncbi:MAG TPA: SMP-30/gluconolactonase/LRE family protein [Woeseiaceae bacterium]|nr:SMP-30/gluconolactonase/LRE family protein [Woeseiaceae bacterium]